MAAAAAVTRQAQQLRSMTMRAMLLVQGEAAGAQHEGGAGEPLRALVLVQGGRSAQAARDGMGAVVAGQRATMVLLPAEQGQVQRQARLQMAALLQQKATCLQ